MLRSSIPRAPRSTSKPQAFVLAGSLVKDQQCNISCQGISAQISTINYCSISRGSECTQCQDQDQDQDQTKEREVLNGAQCYPDSTKKSILRPCERGEVQK